MRYVGNMRRSMPNTPENRTDKAVFPPGSIIPEQVADDAVMYSQNPTMGQQQVFQGNQGQSMQRTGNPQENTRNNAETNDDVAARMPETFRTDGESLRGLMDYEGMEFPLPPGGVLRRTQNGASDGFVGSVEDPRNFSPANGLGGRPTETNMQGMSARGQGGGMMSGQTGIGNIMSCGPNVRLSDVMCMYAGKNIEVEFMFGADTYVKKSGILSGAGMNFIVLTDPETMQKTICDLTDMKFVSISHQSDIM